MLHGETASGTDARFGSGCRHRAAHVLPHLLRGGSVYQDDSSFVRDLLSPELRFGGDGYRRTTRRALFLGNPRNAAPLLVSSASAFVIAGDNPRRRLYKRREREEGVGSARRTGKFPRGGAQGRVAALSAALHGGHGRRGTENARNSVLGAGIISFGNGISKLCKLVFGDIGGLERDAVIRSAKDPPRDDPRRMDSLASAG